MKTRSSMILPLVGVSLASGLAACKPEVADKKKPEPVVSEEPAPAPASSPVTDLAALVGSEWRLADLCGEVLADDAGVTLTFLEDGRVAGVAAVNRYNGEFRLVEDGIEAGPFMTTRMAGEPDAMEREQKFMTALDAATSVSMLGADQLFIAVQGQEQPLRFVRVQQP